MTMNNFARAHNSYLNPPDEPEAVLCESCGEEMEVLRDRGGEYYTQCLYQWCPAKFEGDAAEMAEMLIGATETVKKLARQLKNKTRELDHIVEALSNSGLE
jgi:hypothetical protein